MVYLKDLQHASVRKALEFYDKGRFEEAYYWVELVNENEISKLKSEEALKVADLYYIMGKLEFSECNYRKALSAFNKAHKLKSHNLFLSDRIELLNKFVITSNDEIHQKIDYISFCEKLGVISQKCSKEAQLSYIKHLSCLNIIKPSSVSFQVEETLIKVLYLGAYRPLQRDDKWSRIIRLLKDNPDKAYAVALSKVLSEYLLKHNKYVMRDVDLIISIPPNPTKYVNRGFAPMDLLVECLSKEIALPYRRDLIRTAGGNTRDANEKEISQWYAIQREGMKYIKGTHVLLVDDVSTRGYTIKACSKTLLTTGAIKVTCLVLGRTGG